jgi:hypothetical protein
VTIMPTINTNPWARSREMTTCKAST